MQVIDGGRIARHRKRKGYTQRDMAALCKCSQNTISLIERGEMKTLRPELAELIAKRLGDDLDELFIERLPVSRSPVTNGKSAGGRGRAA